MNLARISAVLLVALAASYAYADCQPAAGSSPNGLTGQTYDCDNGSTLIYQQSPMGDSMTDAASGEAFSTDNLYHVDNSSPPMGGSYDAGSSYDGGNASYTPPASSGSSEN